MFAVLCCEKVIVNQFPSSSSCHPSARDMSTGDNRENMASQQTDISPASSAGKTENSIDDRGPDLGESCIEKVNKLTISDEPCCDRNTGVAVKNVENESLNSLLVYDSDSSSSSSSTSSEMMKLNFNWQSKDDSDTSTSSSSSSSSGQASDSDSSDEEEQSVAEPKPTQSKGAIRKDRRPPKPSNEFTVEKLPPVPDLSSLNISVENEDFVQMGSVLGIVDKLVTVAALPNTPAYDLDTLLFLDNGKRPLGFVFDVLGQVTSPIYAIRFNSVEDIKNLGVEVGTKVYSAPTSKHTQYVFLQQLLKLKGSDASWKDDTECPPEFADFSDDENECYHRHGNRRMTPNVKRANTSSSRSSGDSYKKFETTMNKRNLLNTKFNKYMDSYKQARLNRARRPQGAPQINTSLPSFDPTVPPPNLRQQMAYYQHYGGGVHYVQPEYVFFYEGSGENNNSQQQGYQSSFYMNNFVANLSQTNSANYFTNNAGNNHPGPSHE